MRHLKKFDNPYQLDNGTVITSKALSYPPNDRNIIIKYRGSPVVTALNKKTVPVMFTDCKSRNPEFYQLRSECYATKGSGFVEELQTDQGLEVSFLVGLAQQEFRIIEKQPKFESPDLKNGPNVPEPRLETDYFMVPQIERIVRYRIEISYPVNHNITTDNHYLDENEGFVTEFIDILEETDIKKIRAKLENIYASNYFTLDKIIALRNGHMLSLSQSTDSGTEIYSITPTDEITFGKYKCNDKLSTDGVWNIIGKQTHTLPENAHEILKEGFELATIVRGELNTNLKLQDAKREGLSSGHFE